jgi:phage I-like protein
MMATKESTTTDGQNEMRALHSASLTGDKIPSRVLLTPWGPVESTNGSFIVDEESVRLALAAFEEHGTDLPIDYEHQTLGGRYSSPNGQAPAAGWVKRIFGEPGVGLLAEIEWTAQAAKMLEAKQYRYLSPVAVIRKTDRKLAAIHSAALTNKPAIVGMEPIVNRRVASADEEDDGPLARLRSELDLSPEAQPEEVLLAASRRLGDLRCEAKERHVESRIHEALRAGKLVEAQRAWAEALVACEENLFDEWLRTAPVVIAPGRTEPPTGSLTPQHRAHAVNARARAEFRANPVLSGLTTEEAFVADALRQMDR